MDIDAGCRENSVFGLVVEWVGSEVGWVLPFQREPTEQPYGIDAGLPYAGIVRLSMSPG